MNSKEGTARSWFTAREAARLSTLSCTMLDYLDRSGIIRPSGARLRSRGKSRRYTFSDVVLLRAVARLLGAGLSVKRLKRAFRRLSDGGNEITPDKLPGSHLVTDGTDIYFGGTNNFYENLANGQLAFAFVIGLEGLHKEVTNQLLVSRDDDDYHFQFRAR